MYRLLCGALLLVFFQNIAWGDEITLIRISEQWKYFVAYLPPSGSPYDWTQLEYDDSGWMSGPSGFGSWDNATLFPSAWDTYSSVLTRRRFQVSNPNQIKWLTLRIDYQDGFIAYLNGVEVARRGFPASTNAAIDFHNLAEPHPAGAAEEIDLSASIPLLRPGDNIFAIQIHRSSEFGYFALSAELSANFTRGPFLQNATDHSMQIVWKTPFPASTMMVYGTGQNLDRLYVDTNWVNSRSSSCKI